MEKVFLDTNIFIRFLTQDDPQKFHDCEKLFELVQNGKIRPYTSNIVILEIQFVLIRLYKFAKDKVLRDIDNLLSLRNLTILEKTDTRKALSVYKKHNIKYADCLIATQVPKGVKLASYDTDFSKIKRVSLSTPADFIN